MAKWLDGDPDVAARPRRLELVVTHLEMKTPPRRTPSPPPWLKLALLRAEAMPVGFYRYLYDAVGGPWLWAERRLLDDDALRSIIADPAVEVFVPYVGGVPAGFFEIDRRHPSRADIAHLGLMPDFLGRGLGRHLIGFALDCAWDKGPQLVTARTRSLDHPRALAALQRAGFVAVRQERQVIDYPRAGGIIPEGR
ncbi:MAG: GNAT family N-acetyltransferase [Rhodospirillaceae bacterium]|nr:GNAT family N-acetyltransferase [Rhodospirillaceae bacterium]